MYIYVYLYKNISKGKVSISQSNRCHFTYSLLYHGYIQLQGPWRCQINAAFLEGQGFPITCSSSWRSRGHGRNQPKRCTIKWEIPQIYWGVEPKIGFFYIFYPPNSKSSHFKKVWNHYFHHPFWGTIIFGNTHSNLPYIYIKVWSSPPPKKWVPFNDPCPYICCFWNTMLSSVPWRKIFSEASHYQWVVPMNCQPCPAVGNGWIFLEVPMKRGFIEKKYWRSKSMTIFYNSMIRIDWWCLVFVFRDHGWNTSTCTLHVPSFYHGLKAIV